MPTPKGFKHTEETRKKISVAVLKTLAGKTPWNKGKTGIFTVEALRKMSEARKGKKNFLGHKHSNETRRKISEAQKGRKHTAETLSKMSKAKKGRTFSAEHRRNMSGKRNGSWRGGLSFEPYTMDWTKTLRRSIRERDRYTCQVCGEPQGDKALSIHHIDYDKKNCNPENLISLCITCHIKTNGSRKQWQTYFIGKITEGGNI